MKQTVHPIPLKPMGFVNAFLITGERTILVDTGFPGSDAVIMAALSRYGVSPKSISLILITHGHIDHIGSAYALQQRLGAPVAVHESDQQAVRSGIPPALVPINFIGRMIKGRLENRIARPVEPDVVIIRGMDLGPFGVEGKVIETPGHTAGSISVVLPGGVVIAGDLLAGGTFKKNRPAQAPFHENLKQVAQSVRKVLNQKPTTIHVGHGGPLSPHEVRQFLEKDRALAAVTSPA